MAAHAPKALLMHPGPIIRGLELTSEVADGPQSLIAEQVSHGVAIRMALLARALHGADAKARAKPACQAGKPASSAKPAKQSEARMSATLIRGGRLVDPAAGIDAERDLLLARRPRRRSRCAGKLKALAKQEAPRPSTRQD